MEYKAEVLTVENVRKMLDAAENYALGQGHHVAFAIVGFNKSFRYTRLMDQGNVHDVKKALERAHNASTGDAVFIKNQDGLVLAAFGIAGGSPEVEQGCLAAALRAL